MSDAVLITLIICGTIIIAAWISNNDTDKENKKK